MKRKFLIILSTLFAIAAITLVIIQIAQMQASAKMSDNLFNISVNNSIDKVFTQLDQMKVEDYVSQKERYKMLQYRRIDNMNEKMQDIIRNNSELFYDEDRIQFGISTQDSALVLPGSNLTDQQRSILTQYNTLLGARNRLMNNINYSNEQYRDLVNDHSIDPTKLNFPLLDSIIREELIINGVDIKPSIGIWESELDTLYYCSEEGDSAELRNSPYKYTFHVNGIVTNENLFLVLAFPASPIILTSDANRNTVLSIFMIVLISFLFILSVRTIWTQRKLDEMKTDFISNMTHEIKTPIATIGLACEMLQDDTINNDHDSRRNFVNIINDENRRMRVLIETILQSSKMANKNFSLTLKELDLNQEVEAALQSFQLMIKNKQGILETDLQPISGTLYADQLHISNMVHNLVDNAIKYSPQAPHLQVSTCQEEDWAILKVTDHGIGISKENQKHIFEKFYRVHTGNLHDVKGFGIGLSYVSQVVALHKGKISVESELGQGSTFIVKLPLA